ncbi:MAG TPA: dynamin family protein [Acidobacteriaceae bacterium]|jgi:GTP-binding protein EngB required for normal cell division|nr:dynamin family protein [Acidobacteriaceae bacterium]
MPEQDLNAEIIRHLGELNEHQKTRLKITCQYIDKLLSDVEDILHAATSQSPFPRYIIDINPAQVRVIEDHLRRLRSQLVRTIAWQQMKPGRPDIPASRAVLTNLAFIDIAVEELKPNYMRGSGAVPDDAVSELNGVVYELRSLVCGMERYLKQELSIDLEKRLRRLEEAGSDVALLRFLEQIVTRDGLVEFRPRIDMLASRLEGDSLEVALFGRVSSGKSSLLNALLGTPVLPVGVNPITAVPTKVRYGKALKAGVSYGDGRSAIVTIGELSNLVSEQGNPGNLQNIVQAIVEIPSPRLKQGILLVDTPGLGSLVKRGTAETLAYLPACDLALLLIDAGATLSEEDIGTLRLLYEAGIPALILLSKADLLAEGDLHLAVSYIQQHINRDLGLDIVVHAVSALSQYSVTLDHFYERELLPRFEQAHTLKGASVSRKIGALREAVQSAIEVTLDRQKRKGSSSTHSIDANALEGTLRIVTGGVGEQGTALSRTFREIGETPNSVVDLVAEQAVLWARDGNASLIPSLQLAEWIHDVVWRLVQQPIEKLRSIGIQAIKELQRTSKELGNIDAPSHDDFDLLLRDMPRFELAALPYEITISYWKFLGEGIVRSRIKTSLRESIGSLLKDELHLYGMSLAQWSQQTVRRLEALVNSYADAYRAQIHRIGGVSDAVVDATQLQTDLELLKNWGFKEYCGPYEHSCLNKEK